MPLTRKYNGISQSEGYLLVFFLHNFRTVVDLWDNTTWRERVGIEPT
jgi:hypothetical protein